MMWFVILSGVREHTPLNRVWFLRADTSGIAGSKHPVSQWTFFKICGEFNRNCDKSKAALPLGYAWYDDSTGAPKGLTGNHGHDTTSRYYFYMWRFGWVFYFIAFILANFAVLFGLLACLKIVTVATGLITLASLFFLTLAACLMTFVFHPSYTQIALLTQHSAVFTKARDKFKDEGRAAKVGPYAFGFTWASVVLLFLCSLLYIANAFIGKKHHAHHGASGHYSKEGPYNTYPQGPVQSGYTGNHTGGYTQPLPQQAPQSSVGSSVGQSGMGPGGGYQQQNMGGQQNLGGQGSHLSGQGQQQMSGGGFEQTGQRTVVHDDAPAPTMRGEGRRGLGGRSLFTGHRDVPPNGAPPV